MKSSLLLSLYAAAAVTALSAPREPQVILQEPTLVEPDEYLIELSPGETQWINEAEKWELRKVSITELEAKDRSLLRRTLKLTMRSARH